jgi:hypothetical protein
LSIRRYSNDEKKKRGPKLSHCVYRASLENGDRFGGNPTAG